MKKTIVITAFKRPKALQSLLISLCSNDLTGWLISIRLDPSSQTQKCIALANELLEGHDFELHANDEIEGVRRNTFNAVNSAFSQDSEFVLYLEEDLIVAPDALNLCDWYYSNSADNILCLNLLARATGSSACLSSSSYPKELIKTKSFNSLGVAISKKQWIKFFKDAWLTRPKHHLTYLRQQADGWDFAIYDLLISNQDVFVLQPLFARANHIGGEGTYCTDAYQDKSFSYVEINQQKSSSYCVLDTDQLGALERAFFTLADEMNTCLRTLKEVEKERKDNLKLSCIDRRMRSIKERFHMMKSSEKGQLLLLAAKKNPCFSWLKSLLC